jgi:putative ABC transport system permease protein
MEVNMIKKIFAAISERARRVLANLMEKTFPAIAEKVKAIPEFFQASGKKLLRNPLPFLAKGIVNLLRNVLVFFIAIPILAPKMVSRLADLPASLLSMVVVVFKRLQHNLGLSISAILGIVSVLGMVVCVPIFSHAVSGNVLRQQLTEKAENTRRSLFSMHLYYLDNRSTTKMDVSKSDVVAQSIIDLSSRLMGLTPDQIIMEIQSPMYYWRPEQTQAKNIDKTQPWGNMGFEVQEIIPANSELVEGVWPKATDPDTGPVRVAVIQDAADANYINVGDTYKYQNLVVQVVGIWRPKDPSASVWYDSPAVYYSNKFWIPKEIFAKRLPQFIERPVFYISWYVVMDEAKISYDHATEYARGMVRMDSDLHRLLPGITTDYSPIDALNAYQQRADSLTTLFYAVGGPMVVLALLFISLTANIAMQQYEQEIATMRGRGTSWWQIAMLNLIESVILLLVSLIPSLLVGWLAAGMISKTLSFLQFTNREGLPFNFDGVNFLWLAGAGLLIVLARFSPTLSVSRTTIVRIKQQQSRGANKPLWERFYLDFLLLLPGAYAYLTMSGMTKTNKLLEKIQVPAGGQYRDILLYVAPALFAMALCMITLRILPMLTRLLAKAMDRIPGVWAYLSLQQIARRPQDHASALLLIMISLSLAIYSASTAKTLDKWQHDSIYYKSGADLAIHEYVVESSGGSGGTSGAPAAVSTNSGNLTDANMSFDTSGFSLEDHQKLPSVTGATRVANFAGSFSVGAGEKNVVFMGIDRLDFPKVAFYRDDFASVSLGELMNALGAEPMGALVPKEMAEEIGLRMGDHLLSTVNLIDQQVGKELIVVGTYDYFPTVFPDTDPVIITNLDAFFDNPDAATGYDIWMNVKPDTNENILFNQIRNIIGSEKAVIKVNGNAFSDLTVALDAPERVGVFGVLNVGFIATGLMPGIGFVLYSYASLRRRFIQLGILQALGMSIRQLIGYLVLEQSLLMGLAIVCGAGIGLVCSNLFVPFLQVGATPGAPVPPFQILIGWVESAWLSLGFAMVLFFTMIGTIASLIRMKVFQAVKMGEAL